MASPEEMGNGPVIHDHRRIDPVTGEARQPGGPRGKHASSSEGGSSQVPGGGPGQAEAGRGAEPQGSAPRQPGGGKLGQRGGAAADPEVASVQAQLAERTADLQRVQAEYANYRKRVDRDRTAVRELALAGVLSELLPALDAIGSAREHGELSGGFKSVADAVESAAAKLGLVTYGEKGEPFDPRIHEALTHSYSAEVTEVICAEILQPGYKVGDRILRPARVAVAEPDTGPDGAAESAPAEPEATSDEAGPEGN